MQKVSFSVSEDILVIIQTIISLLIYNKFLFKCGSCGSPVLMLKVVIMKSWIINCSFYLWFWGFLTVDLKKKELTTCLKLDFLNPYISATWYIIQTFDIYNFSCIKFCRSEGEFFLLDSYIISIARSWYPLSLLLKPFPCISVKLSNIQIQYTMVKP